MKVLAGRAPFWRVWGKSASLPFPASRAACFFFFFFLAHGPLPLSSKAATMGQALLTSHLGQFRCYSEILQTEWLNDICVFSQNSGGRVAAGMGESSFLSLQKTTFSLCPYMVERERPSSLVSFPIRTLIPLSGSYPPDLI